MFCNQGVWGSNSHRASNSILGEDMILSFKSFGNSWEMIEGERIIYATVDCRPLIIAAQTRSTTPRLTTNELLQLQADINELIQRETRCEGNMVMCVQAQLPNFSILKVVTVFNPPRRDVYVFDNEGTIANNSGNRIITL